MGEVQRPVTMFRVIGLRLQFVSSIIRGPAVFRLIAILVIAPVLSAAAEESGLDFFEQRIRPLLIDQCYPCHSQSAEKVKGGLLLDTREGLLKGGQSGPVVVSGDPDRSLLIQA